MAQESPGIFSGLATSAAPVVALAPALYQSVRVISRLRSPEADPAAVVWAERSVVLEHIGIAGYLVVALVVLTAPVLMRRVALARGAFDVCVLVGAVAGLAGGALR